MDVYAELSGGDRRSTGRADRVVEAVERDPDLFGTVFDGMLLDDPVVSMRCADAAEKITRTSPELLEPYAQRLLDEVAELDQQEIRWHVALMLPRLSLTKANRRKALAYLLACLDDESRIVRSNAIEGLAGLAEQDGSLRPEVLDVIRERVRTDSPSVRARGRKMLARLERS